MKHFPWHSAPIDGGHLAVTSNSLQRAADIKSAREKERQAAKVRGLFVIVGLVLMPVLVFIF